MGAQSDCFSWGRHMGWYHYKWQWQQSVICGAGHFGEEEGKNRASGLSEGLCEGLPGPCEPGMEGRASRLPIRGADPTNMASLLDGIHDILILSRLTSWRYCQYQHPSFAHAHLSPCHPAHPLPFQSQKVCPDLLGFKSNGFLDALPLDVFFF